MVRHQPSGIVVLTTRQSCAFQSTFLYKICFADCNKSTIGAFTELFAAFSPNLNVEHNGAHITAWGRMSKLPDELVMATKSKSEGGTGNAARFLAYCNKEVQPYV